MKKIHIITKSIWQVFLYLFEVVVIAFIGTLVFNYFKPILSITEFIERMILSYTVYQVLVLVILTNLNDAKKDSYLALLNTLKLCKLYIDSKDKNIKNNIITNVDTQLNPSTFNDLNIRSDYQEIRDNLECFTSTQIEYKIISTERMYEMASLNWRISFLLRIFK